MELGFKPKAYNSHPINKHHNRSNLWFNVMKKVFKWTHEHKIRIKICQASTMYMLLVTFKKKASLAKLFHKKRVNYMWKSRRHLITNLSFVIGI
jgi:hypothetical protein